ncbi:MAG TPA: DUF2461 domain-containing protein [Cytophagaceae bacterium]|nr:DUF2461 domain-containing protein [Cytophagaceae bacterium]
MADIKKESLFFPKTLSKHNNRDWFNAHKDQYLDAQANIIDFADALLDEINKHDTLETESGKKSLYRIYRDVRFSKDKSPYHDYWSGSFKRATKKRRGGYYFHLQPGNSFAAGGFWGPNPEDMKRIREDISYNYEDWQKLLKDKKLIKTFGGLQGEQLSSAPRGYEKDHPAIELLRYKQFLLRHNFSDEEVLSKNFVKTINEVYKNMRPFFDYMSDVLTTDANGSDS